MFKYKWYIILYSIKNILFFTKVTWLEELAPEDSLSLDGLGGFMIDLKIKKQKQINFLFYKDREN